ncbi:4'-phosphopantetheinyl transferase family protein [Ramlibacter humi]|uniref:4'-phosphopantetheinyl transferase family protein n=1 Tax=Ramlibacter humi TaxID=2530451 RepID=UPI001431CC66|nr:4'-phosphopantetheinyl transferase superfamily protein [Ramlibacter humi]
MQSAGVEVWTARPAMLGCDACAAFSRLLDETELERSQRLRFDADRRAFIVAHAMRRMALAMALALDPQDLRFGTGSHGQPVLLGTGVMRAPSFSLSRTRDFVACAVSRDGPVGIDVETIRDGVDASLLARYMQPWDAQGDEAFYVQWTALEAYWKAQGLGLSASHPHIALREYGEDCWSVAFAEHNRQTGLVALRLPAPPTHVLSLACTERDSVRIVELDALANAPHAAPSDALSTCKDGNCGVAAAPRIFSA